MTRISDRRLHAWVTEIDEAARLAGVDPRMAADDLVGELTAAQARELAARFLTEKVTDRRRARTLQVERSVERSGAVAELPGVGAFVPAEKTPPTPEEEAERAEAFARIQAEHVERMAKIEKDLFKSLNSAAERYARELKMEWTRELLESSFAMPDGTVVLWGDATIEQHQERRDMFLRNALANTEGAARHEQAIRDLTQAGAPTLRELVSVDA